MGDVREGIRFGGWVTGTVIGLAVIYVIGIFAFGGAGWITAPFRGEAEKRENTVGSGAFRQATYDEYFALCASAQKSEGTIKALEEERETASDVRQGQIDQSVTALKASRIEAITEYNSLSAQEYKAAFKDNGLPHRLDADADETTCAN